ncbi:hypothetical protein [Chitinimonas sp.]|uniref:hypothetical protein n=1 Tax=Chitinimonas sp. TaxID=1934313 RepID=UPI0035AF029A
MLLALLLLPGQAHELQANRLTLVMREPNHVVVAFVLNYIEVLHRVLDPKASQQSFVLRYSSMPMPALQAELVKAQAQLAAETVLQSANGEMARLSAWAWPTASRVQALLQQRAMQLVVAPTDHPSDDLVEIHADAVTTKPIETLRPRLPLAMMPTLVVSYRPHQSWLAGDKPPVEIRF